MGSILDFLGLGKDVKDAADGVLGGVTKIIDSAKGQVPAEQLVAMETAKNDLKEKLAGFQQAADASLQQFVLQYEGTAAQVKPWLLALRGAIRPVATIIFLLQLAVAASYDFTLLALQRITTDQMILSHLPGGYWVTQSIIVGFWFGGRAGERIAEAFGKASGK